MNKSLYIAIFTFIKKSMSGRLRILANLMNLRNSHSGVIEGVPYGYILSDFQIITINV